MIPHCARCGRDCTDDDYCSGCWSYVCDAHPATPLGEHAPEAHDAEPDEG
jgi:hypothetical protein